MREAPRAHRKISCRSELPETAPTPQPRFAHCGDLLSEYCESGRRAPRKWRRGGTRPRSKVAELENGCRISEMLGANAPNLSFVQVVFEARRAAPPRKLLANRLLPRNAKGGSKAIFPRFARVAISAGARTERIETRLNRPSISLDMKVTADPIFVGKDQVQHHSAEEVLKDRSWSWGMVKRSRRFDVFGC
jgi:hypothetical protein